MCDPISLAGMALSTAGAYGQAQTQSNFTDAVNASNRDAYAISQKARDAERVRQKDFENQQVAAFDDATANMSRSSFDTDHDAAATDFVSTLDARPVAIAPGDALAGGADASDAVKTDAAKRTAAAASETRDRIKALAKLTAYGTAGAGRGRDFTNTADFVSTLGGLRRGSLAAGQQEQTIAPTSVTPGSSTFADILSGVGGMMAYGGNGMFKGAPGATATIFDKPWASSGFWG